MDRDMDGTPLTKDAEGRYIRQPMIDNGVAALAAAIHEGRIVVGPHGKFTDRCLCNHLAAAILTGGAVFLPDGWGPWTCIYCGSEWSRNEPITVLQEHILVCDKHPIATLRAALVLAHDHHSFGPRDCTPANCSAERELATFRPHPDRRTDW